MTTSAEVRRQLVQALRLDLIGPGPEDPLADEQLPGWRRPSNWYLTGFLVPTHTPTEHRGDEDSDEDLAAVPETAGISEDPDEDDNAARRGFFPSSMGLSFLAHEEEEELEVTVRWGDYEQTMVERAEDEDLKAWSRTQHSERVPVSLAVSQDTVAYDVPDSGGLRLFVTVREVGRTEAGLLPVGTRSVSIFLVNDRPPVEGSGRDRAFIFQAEIEVRSKRGFVPRPDLRAAGAGDWDDRLADLHYADTPEYATGHGVSASWDELDDACHSIRTVWLPSAEVERTETAQIESVNLSMDVLGALSGGEEARQVLTPLVTRYRAWIEQQRGALGILDLSSRRETAEELLRRADLAADRMEAGVRALAADADALDAFRMANRAVSRALKVRLSIEKPEWKAFQLAFILLNLPGIVDPEEPGRETVDLLYFPTGGGKTEAYLGLSAFTMVLRRLRNPKDEGRSGAGVAVIMRYTLRLLTLDQLARAAGLVCSLELERQGAPERYGVWPFEIGLWVGKASTPNAMGRKGDGRSDTARSKVNRFKANPDRNPSPIPLEACPWCGTHFTPDSFSLQPNTDNPSELRVLCTDFTCDFSGNNPLPIVAVDEPLYRRLPAFLIATVDKFAALPWVSATGVLLGGAERYDAAGYYGPADPGRGKLLETPLPPPDLVVQDELHLISGPLGTMMGLYETALESLAVRELGGQAIRPKIVASTATVRRAEDQIQALFGRPRTEIFPPPGPSRRDSFFAHVVSTDKTPGRLYLGISSKGRNPKVLMRRTLLGVMGAAERAYRDLGGHEVGPDNPADPYMTALNYFNSLRELGGARRIIEEEVQSALQSVGIERKRLNEDQALLKDRKALRSVIELTSRVSTDDVADARDRLEATFDEERRVDFALATNMISVGLDIQRLGLMLVTGQPKTNSEYIQATSRVGRDKDRPGLVLTLLNVHKPRDRSHYERFRHYHETFYRSVEVPSVTPFSARALDRGLAGTLVGLARHSDRRLTAPRGAEKIDQIRAELEPELITAFEERVRSQPISDQEELEERLRSVRARISDLLDSWVRLVKWQTEVGGKLQYQKYEPGDGKPLLRDMLEENFETVHHRKFRANRSLRGVEPQVNVSIYDHWETETQETV